MSRNARLTVGQLLLALLAASTLACRSAEHPQACAGEVRRELDCGSEVRYDATDLNGGFEVLGVGSGSARSETTALRQIDDETARYIAQARRICDEYNKCVLDRAAYARESADLRRRLAKLPELYRDIRDAGDEDKRAQALARAYTAVVPDERRVGLVLDFSVIARQPGEAQGSVVLSGAPLRTGTQVKFEISVSRPAYVYLFQRDGAGEIATLFPDDRIPIKNPLPASAKLELPTGGGSFTLNDKDIGEERVYVVGSLEPIGSLKAAYDRVATGGAKSDPVFKSLVAVGEQPSCRARALELAVESTACVRSRGLELRQAGAAGPVSLRAETEAADSTIVKVFGFRHTP